MRYREGRERERKAEGWRGRGRGRRSVVTSFDVIAKTKKGILSFPFFFLCLLPHAHTTHLWETVSDFVWVRETNREKIGERREGREGKGKVKGDP